MTNKKVITPEQIDYKFRLLEHARRIVEESIPLLNGTQEGYAVGQNYADRVIDLADKIHAWVYNTDENK